MLDLKTDPDQKSNLDSIEDYLAQIPSCEPWLEENKEARNMVERGLEQAKGGRGENLGCFAEYANLEIEE
jgi:hypothetical protein